MIVQYRMDNMQTHISYKSTDRLRHHQGVKNLHRTLFDTTYRIKIPSRVGETKCVKGTVQDKRQYHKQQRKHT